MAELTPDDIDVKRLRLEPGDIVIVHVDRELTAQEAGNIKALLEPIFAGHAVVVMSREAAIAVVGPRG